MVGEKGEGETNDWNGGMSSMTWEGWESRTVGGCRTDELLSSIDLSEAVLSFPSSLTIQAYLTSLN